MDAIDEVQFRLNSALRNANLKPAKHLHDSHKAVGYIMSGASYYDAFIYERALAGENDKVYAKRAIDAFQQAYDVYQPRQLQGLSQQRYICSILVKQQEKCAFSEKLIQKFEEQHEWEASPLQLVAAYLSNGLSLDPLWAWFKAAEAKANHTVLPGSAEAVNAILQNDETRFIEVIDKMLDGNKKKAQSMRSYIYNNSNALLCPAAFTLTDVAKDLGMDITDKLRNRRQVLKLCLSSPADFPELPKNTKFPIEVDFLTGKVFPK